MDALSRSSWFDLPVTNLADAMAFYKGLLGWEYRQMDNTPETGYVMIDVGGTLIGGLRKITPESRPNPTASSAVLYFTVDKLAPQVARARELGAAIVGEIVNLGQDRGRYQWLRDREGNLIGLWARD